MLKNSQQYIITIKEVISEEVTFKIDEMIGSNLQEMLNQLKETYCENKKTS